MLVLSRRLNEQIIIGDSIVITVVEIRGDKVRLGIDAPQNISVHRREVYEAAKRNGSERSGPFGKVDQPAGPLRKFVNPCDIDASYASSPAESEKPS